MSLAGHISRGLLAVLLLAMPLGAQAQTGNVAGRVVDAITRAPIAGASATVGDRGALTDDDGRFTIADVPVGDYTLRVTQIGYGESESRIRVAAGETTVLQVRLEPSAIELQEMVVIGYGEQEADELTGVIEEIDESEFNQGRVLNAGELIQGKVAGVQVYDTGEPGGGQQIRIRGGTSITSSNEPLFVVDGVPLAPGGGLSAGRNPLNFLNPADIASVTILKDASATAIYGSRGANGVILVETLGGGAITGSQLSYTGSVSGSTIIGEPEMLSTDQFRQAVEGFAPGAVPLLGDADTDWRDAVQQDGVGQEHTIAFSGGDGDLGYRMSVGYLNQEGVLRGTTTERATVSLNYGQGFFEGDLRINANVKGSHTNDTFTPGGVVGLATGFAPTQPIYEEGNAFGGFWEWADYQQAMNNPVAELELTTDEGTVWRSVGDVEATYALPFLPRLTGTARLGYDITTAEREYFRPRFLRGEAESSMPGFVSRRNDSQLNTLFDAFLNYGHRLENAGTDLDFTAGYSYEEMTGEYPYFEADSLAFDYLGTAGIPSAGFIYSEIWEEESRLISFFGRTNVNVADRYLLTLSVRRDGSSRFGPEEQWGTFPSAAVAWRVSREPFMQDVDLFSDLKLRASWGVNGNQAFANYQQYSTYTLGEATASYQFGDQFISTIRPSAADPGIKWEETTSWNFGVDYGVLGGRLNGTIDYYQKTTEDLIFRVPVAAGTNLSNFVTTNIGTLENNGWEFGIDALLYDNSANEGFWWSAGINAATNDNELVQINPFGGGETILTGGIAGGVGNNIQVLMPGQPINTFYVYRHRRDADGLPVWEDANGDGAIDEDDIYIDQLTELCNPDDPSAGMCGDGVINEQDRVPYQSASADWTFGLTSRMGWRAFDASFTMRGATGNHVYNNVASNYGHYRGLSYVVAPQNLHASVLETGFESEQYFSDYYIEDASFLRMDNLTLGYTFEPFTAGQQVRIFGTVQNVFTLTEYRGVDPESGLNGIDNSLYPRSRTFTLGANVQF